MKQICLLVLLYFVSQGFLFAQGDYEIVQGFKNKYKTLEIAIEFARDEAECINIENQISNLKNEFLTNKDLLDNALYPDDFNTMFAKLNKKLEIRKTDVTEIGELQQEVGQLQDQILKLNQENSELIYEIKALKQKSLKDAQSIDSLKTMIKRLKAKIKERDELVMSIVDSLFQTLSIPTELTENEVSGILGKVKNTNLFENMKRSISDNIRFMEVTQLTTTDLSQMKKQQSELAERWDKIGPKLASVYLSKNQSTNEISQINFMFDRWSGQINNQIWNQVNNVFKKKNINLIEFKSGEEFTQNVVNFISDEIKNIGVKDKSESERIYFTFADSIYFEELKPNWIPFLISNGMMTEAMKDTIDARVSSWKDKVAPSTFPMWIVYVGGILLLVIIVLLILNLTKKKQVIYQNSITTEVKEHEGKNE
jgi:hypothetical protein